MNKTHREEEREYRYLRISKPIQNDIIWGLLPINIAESLIPIDITFEMDEYIFENDISKPLTNHKKHYQENNKTEHNFVSVVSFFFFF